MLGIPPGRRRDGPANQIEILQAEYLDRLRLSFWSRLDSQSLAELLRDFPGRSVWMPETSEYAIVSPWRHRPEIASITELSAIRNPALLVDAVSRNARDLGANVLVMTEVEESRRPAFYEKIGFSLLEEVVTYELASIPDLTANGRLQFQVADVRQHADIADLTVVDASSFPWIWRNSHAEFVEYSQSPGVELLIGRLEGRVVACLGLTAYLGWGHIDRVAVMPEHQGIGLGTEAVRFAIQRLANSGAKRIGLSTQRRNQSSQRVYEQLGFRRLMSSDYRLYGKVLTLPDGVSDLFSLK